MMQESWTDILRNLVLPMAVPFFLYLAWDAVSILKRKGYHTVYAEALLRAVGTAANAAAANGLTLADPKGRAIGVQAGIVYLEHTIPDTSRALDISPAGHETRIVAQIGADLLTPGKPPLSNAPSPSPSS